NISEFSAKLTFAESDLRRKSTLFSAKSISGDVYDTAKATRDSIAAQLDAAKAKASYFQMMAPADGKIVKRDGEIGQIINAGTPVFYFTCCAPLRITAEVDEESIAEIKIGMPVLIQSDNFKDKIYHGSVSAITPMGNSVSRSYRVRIAITEADHPFMIGMTTETNIILHQTDTANLLPTSAISPQNKVQKIKDNRIVLLTPAIGSKGTEKTEILSGIEQTDKIVSPYNPKLKEGDKIRLLKE
ncbi:MAG: efflux RND transporter periplasmic adaptor subunit, partial [Pseudomonadota bacterium]